MYCRNKNKRIEKLLSDNILFNQSVLFVGDNDLTSITLALINLPMRICVVDIDEELLKFINKISKEKLNIETFHADLTRGFPTELKGEFNIVFLTLLTLQTVFPPFLMRELKLSPLRHCEQSEAIYSCIHAMEQVSVPQKNFYPFKKQSIILILKSVKFYINLITIVRRNQLATQATFMYLKPTEKTRPAKNISKERFYTNE